MQRSLSFLLLLVLVASWGCDRRTDSRAQQGYDMILAGRVDEALAFANSVLADEPDNAQVRNVLAMGLFKQGDVEASVEHYRRALEVDPKFAEAHFNLGNSLLALNLRDDARAAFEEAVRLEGDFVLARYNLGKDMEYRGEIRSAMEQYEKCIDLDPQFVFGYIDLGKAYYHSARADEAVSMLERAIELDPAVKEIRVLLGNSYLQSEREEQERLALAEGEFRAAVDLDSTYADALYSLGVALATQAKHEEAIPWFEKLLDQLAREETEELETGTKQDDPDRQRFRSVVKQYFDRVGHTPASGASG